MNLLEAYENNIQIPVQIFSYDLSPLESIVKYLKENIRLNYHDIGVILNRDERTIWKTYNNSKKKNKDLLIIKKEKYFIPVKEFSNRKFSILESICLYLIEFLSIPDIARLLNKNPSSMYTVKNRAIKKKNED
ncbi:hypothetical protein GF327_05370 [Candidatus Woesearchaeota archaeon]|nr:hypothetical protein [Candidatus Woesearchaeota archaeon]